MNHKERLMQDKTVKVYYEIYNKTDGRYIFRPTNPDELQAYLNVYNNSFAPDKFGALKITETITVEEI